MEFFSATVVDPIVKKYKCVSIVKTCELEYLWEINNFSLLPKTCTISSEPFTISTHSKMPKFILSLKSITKNFEYPIPQVGSLISIVASCESHVYPISAKIVMCILKGGAWCETATEIFEFRNKNFLVICQQEQSFWLSEGSDDKLKILFKITVMDWDLGCNTTGGPLPHPITPRPVGEELNDLRKQEKGTDCTFVFKDNYKLKAHELIVSLKSNVLAAMFSSKMIEGENNSVTIPDIDHKVFALMLDYMYTGKYTTNDYNTKLQVLAAADKYGVDGLKNACEVDLISILSEQSAVQCLVYAHLHSLPTLKVHAMSVIHSLFTAIKKSNSWKDLKENYPALFTEVLLSM